MPCIGRACVKRRAALIREICDARIARLDRDHFKLPAQLLVTVQFDKEASQAVLNHKNRDAPRGSPGFPLDFGRSRARAAQKSLLDCITRLARWQSIASSKQSRLKEGPLRREIGQSENKFSAKWRWFDTRKRRGLRAPPKPPDTQRRRRERHDHKETQIARMRREGSLEPLAIARDLRLITGDRHLTTVQ
jgi:hypothetical protein